MTPYSVLLGGHILCGATALLTGSAALALRKGGPGHVKTGIGFVIAMLGMGVTGVGLALIRPNFLFIVTGLFATYLALTGWRAARRRDSTVGLFERAALVFSILVTIGTAVIGAWHMAAGTGVSGFPAPLFLGFAFEGLVFAMLDARVLAREGHSGKRRIADHLWRMIVAMVFASTAFFVANAGLFPPALQQPYITWAPIGLLHLLLVYWLFRVLRRERTQPAA